MLIEKDRPFYSVVQAAEILGLSPDRLRTYDEEYLVAPVRNTKSKKRLYSELDIEWLQGVRFLISKNKMNIYSFKLILKLVYKISDEDLENMIKTDNDNIWITISKMKQNPNFEKLKEFYN